jgi:hypothetical protein
VRVLEDWCRPFPGFFLYYPSRRQQPAARAALVDSFDSRIVVSDWTTLEGLTEFAPINLVHLTLR